MVIGNAGPAFEPRPIQARFLRARYRPDTVTDGWSTERFVVRAASLRGPQHRYYGAPRQDDFARALLHGPERLVIAVADGVSAAEQSHLGAAIAVNDAIRRLAGLLENYEASSIDWLELMRHVAWQLGEQVPNLFPSHRLEPAARPSFALEHLATTLVCAVVEFPDGTDGAKAWVAGVGDSGAWLLTEGRFERVLGGKPETDSPITSSAVSGLPLLPKERAPVQVSIRRPSVLLIGTDGFGDPLGSGEGAFGRAFSERLAEPPTMLEFAHSLDFSRETFDDDRTLVSIWFTDRGAPAPAAPPAA